MPKFTLVRGSEVSDFLRCRLRWRYKWVDKLKPKRQDGKLLFGDAFHKFVEVYYNVKPAEQLEHGVSAELRASLAMDEFFDKTDTSRMDQVELDELKHLANEVTTNYVEMWGKQDAYMNVIATEFTFAVPLANGIAYTGTIDLLWKTPSGHLWFSDHKTTNSLQKYIDRAPMDRQIDRYYWALQQLARGNGYVLDKKTGKWKHMKAGELPEPHGFMYNLIARDVPKVPELLKKGGLSTAKAQKTTVALYMKALHDNGLLLEDGSIPEGYHEILQHLHNQEDQYGNKFFKRVPVYRQPDQLEAAIQEFYATAVEMLKLKKQIRSGAYLKLKHDPIYRNITDDCGWDCSFKSLCVASMDNSSTVDLVEMFYEKEQEVDEHINIRSRTRKD